MDLEVVACARRRRRLERARARADVVLGDDQAGVPNSRASSSASQPPISRRPSSREAAAERVRGRELSGRRRPWRRRITVTPMRAVHTEPPADIGVRDGLAYALFLPAGRAAGGVVILHGAGSQQGEPLRLRARVRARAGLAAVAFDQRGHGDERRRARRPARSTTSRRWRGCCRPARRVALRGLEHGRLARARRGRRARTRRRSSRSARRRAPQLRARPARPALRRSAPTRPRSSALLERDDLAAAAAAPRRRGCCSCTPRATSACRSSTRARCTPPRPAAALEVVPGGHHRSVQHDPELQALAVRFIAGRCGAR